MPDLSHKACSEFWHDFPDPTIYKVLTFMESVEEWTLDGDENLEKQLETLGQELDDIDAIDLSKLGHEDAFLKLASNLKMSRVLKLLQSIDAVHPGSASNVIMNAEQKSQKGDGSAQVFLNRNIVFERLRLLGRVFAEERFNLIIKALEGEDL